MTDSMHPCPACGFLTEPEGLGSYNICSVCGWENDRLQYEIPEYTGGANRESLIEAQAEVLQEYPLTFTEPGGWQRATGWRPVESSDLGPPEEEHGRSRRRLKVSDHQRYYWE